MHWYSDCQENDLPAYPVRSSGCDTTSYGPKCCFRHRAALLPRRPPCFTQVHALAHLTFSRTCVSLASTLALSFACALALVLALAFALALAVIVRLKAVDALATAVTRATAVTLAAAVALAAVRHYLTAGRYGEAAVDR